MTLGIWRKPDNRSVRSHQKLVDAINQTAHVSATGDLSVEAGPHGTGVHDERVGRWVDFREAVLVDEGPDAAADFTNNRYWAAFVNIVAGGSDAAANPVKSPPGPRTAGGTDYAERYPVVAVNRREQEAESHSLPVDGTCWVLLKGYIDSGGAKRWVFDGPATSRPGDWVKIESALGGGGLYSGHVYDQGTQAADDAGVAGPPEGLTAGESVLIINQDEAGVGLHRALLGSYAVGFRLPGLSTETVPRPVYALVRPQYQTTAPVDHGDADLDPDGTPVSDPTGGDTWDSRDSGIGTLAGVPFNRNVVTEIDWVAGPGPGGSLKFRRRTDTYDADGRLAHVGEAQDISVPLPG